jgi:outer membrane protein OmpA-like peptidoglycan-associated protein
LQADVTGLEKAMKDLGAQVKKEEIHVDLPGDVLFDFEKTDLKPAAQETLKKLAAIVRAKSKSVVQIDGYTDSKGSDPYNQKLSEGRAESVEKWLATNGGISAVGLQTKGFGKATRSRQTHAPTVPTTQKAAPVTAARSLRLKERRLNKVAALGGLRFHLELEPAFPGQFHLGTKPK